MSITEVLCEDCIGLGLCSVVRFGISSCERCCMLPASYLFVGVG